MNAVAQDEGFFCMENGERKFAQAAKPEPKLLRRHMTRHTENPDTPKTSEERAMQNPGALKHRHRALVPASTEEDLNSGALKHRRVSLAPWSTVVFH